MKAKEYLQQVKLKEAKINNLQSDKDDLNAMLYSLGGVQNVERVQNSRNNDKFGTLYARIDEKEQEITEKMDELIDFKLKVSGEINELKDERYVKLLHRRYIQVMSWDRIAEELGYTYQYVISLHSNALQEFEKKYKHLLLSA